MKIPTPTFITEKEVPQNKQGAVWLRLLDSTPKGQSAVLTFSDKAEAQRRQANIVSVISQHKKHGQYTSFKVTRNDNVLYITNRAGDESP